MSEFTKNQILNYSYTGAVQSVTLPAGEYKLEVWGAQGGSYSTYYGGAGGYSVGTLTLTDDSTTLYIYVGGQPTSTSSTSAAITGGFNGGGSARVHSYSSTTTYCQAGGGGTDIRLGQDSLYARVIVAGGGGGSASIDAKSTKYGGGTTGGSPAGTTYAGSQTSGGTVANAGSFGVGGAGYTSGYNYKYASGGGGGGWYGGSGSSKHSDSSSAYRNYNGGGSGYVYTAGTASNYPSGCLLNSAYYLADAQTIAGNASMPSTSGSTETGHEGNGYARITVLSLKSNYTIYPKVNGKWKTGVGVWIRENGEWKTVSALSIKNNGNWYSSGGGGNNT